MILPASTLATVLLQSAAPITFNSEVSNDSTSGTIVLSKEGVPFTVTVNTKDYDFKKSIIITKTQED